MGRGDESDAVEAASNDQEGFCVRSPSWNPSRLVALPKTLDAEAKLIGNGVSGETEGDYILQA